MDTATEEQTEVEKGHPNKITRKEFDRLNTREEWRKRSDVTNTGGNDDDTKRKLKDGGAVGIYHYNVRTDLDVNAEDFVKAIERGSHTEGECWINTLIDHYEDTLMSAKK